MRFDPEGRFEFAPATDEMTTVEIFAGGYEPKHVALPAGRTDLGDVQLVDARQARVKITVRDDEGRLVNGADVRSPMSFSRVLAAGNGVYVASVVSHAAAQFRVDVTSGEQRGHAMASRNSELTIVIGQRRTHITGTVVDASGQGVAMKVGYASLDTHNVVRYVESDSRGQFDLDVQEGEVHFLMKLPGDQYASSTNEVEGPVARVTVRAIPDAPMNYDAGR